MRKWEELDYKEQTRALNKNVPLLDTDTTYTHVQKETAFIQLVSTGPYYFDQHGGMVYVGPPVTVCPSPRELANRVWKYDMRTQKSRVEQQ